jgi:hypothetical protein
MCYRIPDLPACGGLIAYLMRLLAPKRAIQERKAAVSGVFPQEQQSLAAQFGHLGIGVPEKRDQNSNPGKLVLAEPHDRKVVCHFFYSRRSLRPPTGILQQLLKKMIFQDFFQSNDKYFVSAFLKHAEEIFATAREGAQDDCELAILVSSEGAIHMLPASDWELEPLRKHHGASAAYRISRTCGRVRLEARSGSETCTLQSEQPAYVLRSAIPDFPQYVTIN